MNIEVNFLAVLIAGIASMATGFAWYSPAIVGIQWMREMGYTKESLKKAQAGMGKMYALSFVLSLTTAYVLYHVMIISQAFYGEPPVTNGLLTAFWSWVGFIMPIQATDVIFGGKKWKLFWINTGYQLVSLLIMGLIIGLMI